MFNKQFKLYNNHLFDKIFTNNLFFMSKVTSAAHHQSFVRLRQPSPVDLLHFDIVWILKGVHLLLAI
jgi:hypothetical protein